MLTAAWMFFILMTVGLVSACRDRPRAEGLDFLMVMRVAQEPKKPRGRAQQTKAHRRAKTRR